MILITLTNILKLQISFRKIIGTFVIRIGIEFRLFLFFFAEGLMGMAVAGGVIIGVASILGLGIAMAKKN